MEGDRCAIGIINYWMRDGHGTKLVGLKCHHRVFIKHTNKCNLVSGPHSGVDPGNLLCVENSNWLIFKRKVQIAPCKDGLPSDWFPYILPEFWAGSHGVAKATTMKPVAQTDIRFHVCARETAVPVCDTVEVPEEVPMQTIIPYDDAPSSDDVSDADEVHRQMMTVPISPSINDVIYEEDLQNLINFDLGASFSRAMTPNQRD